MSLIELPRTVDDPPYFLMWRMDDFAPPTLMLGVGFLLDRPMMLAAAGLVLGFFYRRYREGRPEMFALHAMYWLGIWPTRGRTMRNPFQRTYLP
ncbi:MAG: type IV conjugative transfer system protein TraL [Alphaproteobacteria bacterium]|nr:type IV conjugative transfer system protein TraL [Alphaproteobacteria bacterium]